MKECCENCRYWNKGIHSGRCRRYPPALGNDEESFVSVFPYVEWDEWCGEFKFTQEYLNESREKLKLEKLVK